MSYQSSSITQLLSLKCQSVLRPFDVALVPSLRHSRHDDGTPTPPPPLCVLWRAADGRSARQRQQQLVLPHGLSGHADGKAPSQFVRSRARRAEQCTRRERQLCVECKIVRADAYAGDRGQFAGQYFVSTVDAPSALERGVHYRGRVRAVSGCLVQFVKQFHLLFYFML